MPKTKHRSQMSGRHLRPRWPDTDDGDQGEENDRLLLSALKYWAVERDLIEDRLERLGVDE
jgi:hypothetical protein